MLKCLGIMGKMKSMRFADEKRERTLDIIRGLASVLVIAGHNVAYGSGVFLTSGNHYNNIVFKIIYSFHMPLFKLLSGYTFWVSIQKQSGREVLIKRCR